MAVGLFPHHLISLHLRHRGRLQCASRRAGRYAGHDRRFRCVSDLLSLQQMCRKLHSSFWRGTGCDATVHCLQAHHVIPTHATFHRHRCFPQASFVRGCHVWLCRHVECSTAEVSASGSTDHCAPLTHSTRPQEQREPLDNYCTSLQRAWRQRQVCVDDFGQVDGFLSTSPLKCW